jgi:dTDP-4-amino-4,6-dideoxygalactose transaminase
MGSASAARSVRDGKNGQAGVRVAFHRAEVGEEEARAVAEVVRGGWLTSGEKCKELEEKFAKYVGAEEAVAVASGTAALHLALQAAGVGSGDEVIVPATTFTATAAAVMYAGARPVLADVDAATMNLCVEDAARRLTARTKAIIPVHLAGMPCDMVQIAELAKRRGLRVIEDAAHALPAEYSGVRVGAISEFTCFSFYATKPVTTGEGGMIALRGGVDAARRLRAMRLHGIERDGEEVGAGRAGASYEVNEAGYKYNLSDVNAAMGVVQLGKCDEMWRKRREIARRYTEMLRGEEPWEVPAEPAGRESAWHLYILRIREGTLRIGRDEVLEEMRRRGVECSVHFRPLNLFRWYQREVGYREGDFPVAEREYRRCFSLPIYPGLKDEDVQYVGECLKEIGEEFGR